MMDERCPEVQEDSLFQLDRDMSVCVLASHLDILKQVT